VKKNIFLLASILLLASCTSISPVTTDTTPVQAWQQRQQALTGLTHWKINGRVFIRANNEGEQLNLYWVRDNDHHEINLAGPLNVGSARLTLDPGKATLVADDKTYRAENAEQLLADVNGWRLPINGLDYWIRGLPAPGADSEQVLDHRNRLQQLIQSEWEIHYQSYTRVGNRDLPRTIFIKRIPAVTDTAAELIEIRIAVSSWAQVSPGAARQILDMQ
jgi:outer membrane lipoprotein LolB